jgi:hypothetical protein
LVDGDGIGDRRCSIGGFVDSHGRDECYRGAGCLTAVVVVIAVAVKKAVVSISSVVADVKVSVMAEEERDIWSMIVVATTT